MGSGASKSRFLPVPSGPFGVGCADLMTDSSQDGVFFRLYYPTPKLDLKCRQLQQPPWIPREEYLDGYCQIWPPAKFRFFYKKKIGRPLKIPALWHAPLAAHSVPFPVMVFSHGLGCMRTTYSTFCCEIASQGFVVAALEHREGSACWSYFLEGHNEDFEFLKEKPLEHQSLVPVDKEFEIRNSQLQKRVSECIWALHLLEELQLGISSLSTRILLHNDFPFSQFKDRLDLSRAVMAGHSFGGATTIAACGACSDFCCGVVLDAWMFPLENDIYSTVTQPLLFLNTDAVLNTDYDHWDDNIRQQMRLDSTSVDRPMFTIKDSVHQSQTDLTFLLGFLGKRLKARGPICPLLCNQINTQVSAAFIFRHLGLMNADTDTIGDLVSRYQGWLLPGTTVSL